MAPERTTPDTHRGPTVTAGRATTGSERRCEACGSFVTTAFARVFGDNENRVHGCPECLRTRDLRGGEPAYPEGQS